MKKINYIKKVIVITTITFLFLGQMACEKDHYRATKQVMKEGKLIFQKPYYDFPLQIIHTDSSRNTFVWATKVRFPPNTTQHLFLIDTGSPTVISLELFKKLQKNVLFTYYNDYQSIDYDISQIDSLAVGEAVFSQIAVVVANFPLQSFFDKYQIKGIIGGNMIEKGLWYFDGQEKTVSLHQTLQTVPKHADFQSFPIVRDVFRVPKTYFFLTNFLKNSL